MAPLRERPSRDAKPIKSILKKTSNGGTASISHRPEPLFPTSKKDKRRIKHAQIINKVTKSAEKKPRRRRPNKKLATTLDALADALPDDNNGPTQGSTAGEGVKDQINIIRRKSMKSRPGAMKRRENIDKTERDRFAKNMAQLATPKASAHVTDKENAAVLAQSSAVPSTSERWAALRGFISQTLETKPELQRQKT